MQSVTSAREEFVNSQTLKTGQQNEDGKGPKNGSEARQNRLCRAVSVGVGCRPRRPGLTLIQGVDGRRSKHLVYCVRSA